MSILFSASYGVDTVGFLWSHFPSDSLCSLSREQLIFGKLKVLLAVTGGRPARHALPRLHLCRVVEAKVVVSAQNHPVTLMQQTPQNMN